MVKETHISPSLTKNMPFWVRIIVSVNSKEIRDSLLAALEPKLAAIDSKRVTLQIKPSRNQLVFRLAAKDATALRAAAMSLIRLYCVADGVLQLTVTKNE